MGGKGWGGWGEAGGTEFFLTKHGKLIKKKRILEVGEGGGGARVNDFFLHRIQILKKFFFFFGGGRGREGD